MHGTEVNISLWDILFILKLLWLQDGSTSLHLLKRKLHMTANDADLLLANYLDSEAPYPETEDIIASNELKELIAVPVSQFPVKPLDEPQAVQQQPVTVGVDSESKETTTIKSRNQGGKVSGPCVCAFDFDLTLRVELEDGSRQDLQAPDGKL